MGGMSVRGWCGREVKWSGVMGSGASEKVAGEVEVRVRESVEDKGVSGTEGSVEM